MNINPDACAFEQGFGASPATYAPLAGHPGIDLGKSPQGGGYGSPIHAIADMHAYKVLTPSSPSNDGSGFTGVFGIVDDGIELYELLYGHCDPTIMQGVDVKKGDIIGTEANHGLVFQGNTQITLAMQKAGDRRGSHRHMQKRPVFRTPTMTQPALSEHSDVTGTYRDPEGFYYQIFNHSNGFNGCVDPTKSIFNRDLTVGSEGYDVFVLQRILIKEGHATFPVATAYFGAQTKASLSAYQRALQIEPTLGYFGPRTRANVQSVFGV